MTIENKQGKISTCVKAYPIYICEPREIQSGVFYRVIRFRFVHEVFTNAVVISQFLSYVQFLHEENHVTTNPFEQHRGIIVVRNQTSTLW